MYLCVYLLLSLYLSPSVSLSLSLQKSKAKLRLGTFLRKGSEASVLHSKADGDQVNASQWDDSRWCQETQVS